VNAIHFKASLRCGAFLFQISVESVFNKNIISKPP
jgi:hypothetical protein